MSQYTTSKQKIIFCLFVYLFCSFFSCFRENGLENVITLVKGKAEEVTLPVDKVN